MTGRKASEAERREQIVSAAYAVAQHAGISGLTLRAVAARAHLSHGLVLFHFKRKDNLVRAVLHRVIASTMVLQMRDEIEAIPSAADRLHGLLRCEVERLAREPRQMRLFLEYLALGARDRGIRRIVSAAVERYREGFRTLAEEVLRAGPGAVPDVTPDGLAAVAMSVINGGAAQAMLDPRGFDVEAYVHAGRGLIDRFAATTA